MRVIIVEGMLDEVLAVLEKTRQSDELINEQFGVKICRAQSVISMKDPKMEILSCQPGCGTVTSTATISSTSELNDAMPAAIAARIGQKIGAIANQRKIDLSCRERAIIAHLMEGHCNKVIARDLNVALPTVKTHLRNVLNKIGARNRTQAAMWGMANLVTAAETQKAPAF